MTVKREGKADVFDIKWIRDNPAGVRRRPEEARPRAVVGRADRARRGAPRARDQAAGGAGAPQRGLQGDRQGQGGQGRGQGAGADGRGGGAEGRARQGRGGRARAGRQAARCAVRHPQPAARRRAGRQGREGQQGGAQGRRAAEVRLQAQAALRDRRGAGPDGLRDGGEDFRRPLRRAEGRAGAARARARRLHARPAHAARFGYTEISVAAAGQGPRRRTAPATCRSSPRTCFQHAIRSASGSSPPPKCR